MGELQAIGEPQEARSASLVERVRTPWEMHRNIQDIKNELDIAKDLYQDHLFQLFDKMQSVRPGTMFFIDRSARPVAWMLKGMWKGLQEAGRIPDDAKFPEVRFISLGRNATPTLEATTTAQERYSFDKDAPVLVVDEFTDRIDGSRTVDFAKNTIQSVLGANDIHTHVFMDRMDVGAEPRFYKMRALRHGKGDIHNIVRKMQRADRVKSTFYQIEDSTPESLESRKLTSTPTYPRLRKRYRTMFIDFGKKAAAEYHAA